MIQRFLTIIIVSFLLIILAACSVWPFKHKQAEPLEVNPIVIPEGVPPIKIRDYYESVPVATAKEEPVSLLPPGSILSKQSNEK